MDDDSLEVPAQDVGVGPGSGAARPSFSRDERPSGRVLAAVVLTVGVLVAVFALGRAAGAPSEPAAGAVLPVGVPTSDSETIAPLAAPISTSTPVPTTEPTATPTPEPTATPIPLPVAGASAATEELVDTLGEGTVLAEIDFGNRSRAVLWCRETVPGTSIASTLALLHLADSAEYGQQLISYEELTKPWIPGGNGRRGVVLETEGLGTGNSVAPGDAEGDEAAVLGVSDGSRCESCTPTRVDLDETDALIGSCVHGVPFRAGIVYAISSPTRPGQSPLALHASCGVTTIRQEGNQLVIEAEAPLLRGLHEESFVLPPISLVREGGVFRADDLELFDWHCDIARSSQLADRHLLRTEPERQISYSTVETLIGQVGVRGPVAIGLSSDQCAEMTGAWWGRSVEELETTDPISRLLGLDPPPEHDDWFYICQVE